MIVSTQPERRAVSNLLFCVGKAVADVGLVELAAVAGGDPLVAAGLVAKVAAAAWKEWREDKKQDKLNADVLDAAKKSFEEAKQAAIDVAKQVTPDPELQGYVERFVTLVPASIRATLRRPEDPTGTSVPNHFAVHDSDDLVKLLPARLPRFKAGDTPAFLRGWRLVEQIGAGGFGEVWKAQNTRAGNLVNAVKFGHGLSEAEQTLLNEGDVLNRILAEGHHDGIVKLLDVWADGDAVPWLRYEYIAGGDLTAQIHRWQSLPAEQRVDRALDALTQIAGTVGHFHTLNPFIVHRDLKPSNILFDPTAKRFKVADFGIGGVSSRRLLSADSSMSLTAGAVVASYLRGSHTPLYASPQQRTGSKHLDPRDDVHAMGVIAYQMVTGQLDAAPGSDCEHEMEDCGAPAELIALVKSCTSRDPSRRPRTAAAVGELVRTPVVRYEVVEDGPPADAEPILLPEEPIVMSDEEVDVPTVRRRAPERTVRQSDRSPTAEGRTDQRRNTPSQRSVPNERRSGGSTAPRRLQLEQRGKAVASNPMIFAAFAVSLFLLQVALHFITRNDTVVWFVALSLSGIAGTTCGILSTTLGIKAMRRGQRHWLLVCSLFTGFATSLLGIAQVVFTAMIMVSVEFNRQ